MHVLTFSQRAMFRDVARFRVHFTRFPGRTDNVGAKAVALTQSAAMSNLRIAISVAFLFPYNSRKKNAAALLPKTVFA
jgi:hypothetical protein